MNSSPTWGMDPGVRSLGMKADPPGYLWSNTNAFWWVVREIYPTWEIFTQLCEKRCRKFHEHDGWLCPAKTRISLGICPVWSESSLSAWRKRVLSYRLSAHWRLWSDWADSHFFGFVMPEDVCEMDLILKIQSKVYWAVGILLYIFLLRKELFIARFPWWHLALYNLLTLTGLPPSSAFHNLSGYHQTDCLLVHLLLIECQCPGWAGPWPDTYQYIWHIRLGL